MTLRRRTFHILRSGERGDRLGRKFDVFILSLISINVVAIILDSVNSIHLATATYFKVFEVFSIAVFTLEYILRLWTVVEEPRHARPVAGRVRAATSPLMLIDLLAILPFYIPFVGLDLRFLRILRLFRVFLVAKVARYSKALQTLGRVIYATRGELAIAGFSMILLMIMSAALMYYAENEAQPKAFSSVPASMWWAITTMTTVGYGDMYPITPMGKVLGSIISILGIAMFAVPTGILGAGFTEEIRRRNASNAAASHEPAHAGPTICPHCGKAIAH